MGHRSVRYQMEALTLLRELDEHSKVGHADRTRVHGPEDFTVKSSTAQTRDCHKTQTIAERARESMFSRLVEILSHIIAIQQDLMGTLSEDLRKFLRLKDNIDLKNICLRMTLSETGYQSDKDLRELRVCLQHIVNGLILAVRDEDRLSSTGAIGRLQGICVAFPDI